MDETSSFCRCIPDTPGGTAVQTSHSDTSEYHCARSWRNKRQLTHTHLIRASTCEQLQFSYRWTFYLNVILWQIRFLFSYLSSKISFAFFWKTLFTHNFTPHWSLLWNNRTLFVNRNLCFKTTWLEEAILFGTDLMDNNGILLNHKELFGRYNPHCTCECFKMCKAIPVVFKYSLVIIRVGCQQQ